MSRRRTLLALLPVVASLAACNADVTGRPKICTTLFAIIPVVVVDARGAPVAGITVTDSVLRTHERFAIPQSFNGWSPGTFNIFDDSFSGRIRESGDAVRVTGSNGILSFAADFVFGVPDGCHVAKISGPDTVVAR
jgi:hypothetical protein